MEANKQQKTMERQDKNSVISYGCRTSSSNSYSIFKLILLQISYIQNLRDFVSFALQFDEDAVRASMSKARKNSEAQEGCVFYYLLVARSQGLQATAA